MIVLSEFHAKLVVMLEALESYSPKPGQEDLVTEMLSDLRGELCAVSK